MNTKMEHELETGFIQVSVRCVIFCCLCVLRALAFRA